MTKRDIYNKILDVTCILCEVNKDDILHGIKRSECVEARCIATHFLLQYGVQTSDIIRFSDNIIKHKYCITKSATAFHEKYKHSFSFRCDADSVGNILQKSLQ